MASSRTSQGMPAQAAGSEQLEDLALDMLSCSKPGVLGTSHYRVLGRVTLTHMGKGRTALAEAADDSRDATE